MSVERPRRNARKLPDPDFYTDLPSLSPPRGQKRRFSFDANLDAIELLLEAEVTPKKSHKKADPKASQNGHQATPTKSPPKRSHKKKPPPNTLLAKTPEKNGPSTTPKSPPKSLQKTPQKTPQKQVAKTPPRSHKKKIPIVSQVTESDKSPTVPQVTVSDPKESLLNPKSPNVRKRTRSKLLQLHGKLTSPGKNNTKLALAKKTRVVKTPLYKALLLCKVPSCARKTFCFIEEKDCSKSGYSPRWYHVSPGEHYCNHCFENFYRSFNPGHGEYLAWRRKWAANSQLEVTSKLFAANYYLPYWLRCTTCSKWRAVPRTTTVTPQVIQSYTCGKLQGDTQSENPTSCSDPEDERVADAQESSWITSLQIVPYLESSPAAPYLTRYYTDGVGMTPVSRGSISAKIGQGAEKTEKKDSDSDSSLSTSSDETPHPNKTDNSDPTQIGFFQPFHQPGEVLRAHCFPPDVMLDFELENFPEYAKLQPMYLGLRNLVLTLWCTKFKEWLTPEKCEAHVICRGLGRVRAVQELDRLIAVLTRRCYINAGVLDPPPQLKVLPESLPKEKVLVIGAGPSGLAAARQLHRFGIPVTVLEARDRIGGRVWDDDEMSIRVGHGAMIIVGHINNPITLLCEQLGLRTRTILDHCDLFREDGAITECDMDQRIEAHFNTLLDQVAEWRRNRTREEDVDLLSRIEDMHRDFPLENQQTFNQEEKLLLQFHVSNLEYACGCELDKASALHWDQNEFYPQFTGYHSMITDGYSELLGRVSEGLDIQLNTQVSKISYGPEGVTVATKSGEVLQGSKVIVTVPLAILQKGLVEFDPPLPAYKIEAIHGLGAGIIEKVALEFPTRFWDEKLKGADFFGLVPSSEDKRGLFGVFYDITPREEGREDRGHVLMTWVSGSAIRLIEDKTDQEVVDMCVDVLRKVFSDKEVCEPIGSFVTRWGRDPHSLMSYSYVPVGSSGESYEGMARDVDGTIFFAGEATNRQFPQTVTGAYLSGQREANKILETCFTPLDQHKLITVKEDVPGKRGRKASLVKVVKMSPLKVEPELRAAVLPVKLEGLDDEPATKLPVVEEGVGKSRTSTAWVRAPRNRSKSAAGSTGQPNGETVPRKRGRPRKNTQPEGAVGTNNSKKPLKISNTAQKKIEPVVPKAKQPQAKPKASQAKQKQPAMETKQPPMNLEQSPTKLAQVQNKLESSPPVSPSPSKRRRVLVRPESGATPTRKSRRSLRGKAPVDSTPTHDSQPPVLVASDSPPKLEVSDSPPKLQKDAATPVRTSPRRRTRSGASTGDSTANGEGGDTYSGSPEPPVLKVERPLRMKTETGMETDDGADCLPSKSGALTPPPPELDSNDIVYQPMAEENVDLDSIPNYWLNQDGDSAQVNGDVSYEGSSNGAMDRDSDCEIVQMETQADRPTSAKKKTLGQGRVSKRAASLSPSRAEKSSPTKKGPISPRRGSFSPSRAEKTYSANKSPVSPKEVHLSPQKVVILHVPVPPRSPPSKTGSFSPKSGKKADNAARSPVSPRRGSFSPTRGEKVEVAKKSTVSPQGNAVSPDSVKKIDGILKIPVSPRKSSLSPLRVVIPDDAHKSPISPKRGSFSPQRVEKVVVLNTSPVLTRKASLSPNHGRIVDAVNKSPVLLWQSTMSPLQVDKTYSAKKSPGSPRKASFSPKRVEQIDRPGKSLASPKEGSHLSASTEKSDTSNKSPVALRIGYFSPKRVDSSAVTSKSPGSSRRISFSPQRTDKSESAEKSPGSPRQVSLSQLHVETNDIADKSPVAVRIGYFSPKRAEQATVNTKSPESPHRGSLSPQNTAISDSARKSPNSPKRDSLSPLRVEKTDDGDKSPISPGRGSFTPPHLLAAELSDHDYL